MTRDAGVLALFAGELVEIASEARAEVDAGVDALEVARRRVENALERCRIACETAERYALFAARAQAGDVSLRELETAVHAIEEIVGARIEIAYAPKDVAA